MRSPSLGLETHRRKAHYHRSFSQPRRNRELFARGKKSAASALQGRRSAAAPASPTKSLDRCDLGGQRVRRSGWLAEQ